MAIDFELQNAFHLDAHATHDEKNVSLGANGLRN